MRQLKKSRFIYKKKNITGRLGKGGGGESVLWGLCQTKLSKYNKTRPSSTRWKEKGKQKT